MHLPMLGFSLILPYSNRFLERTVQLLPAPRGEETPVVTQISRWLENSTPNPVNKD